MADVIIDSVASGRARDRLRVLGWLRLQDNGFRLLTLSAALAVLLILGGVIASLAIGSVPAFKAFGLGFLTAQAWNPVTEKFGALPAIYGTLATSAIAMFFAVPIGLGIAVFLTELCPLSAAPSDRRRNRTAGRAFPRSSTASGASSSSRLSCKGPCSPR